MASHTDDTTLRLPRYEVLRRLGGGGAGEVYLARDLLSESSSVALKVFHRSVVPRTILGEFRILRTLRHPGIPKASDFGRVPATGQFYIAMDYVSGPSLKDCREEVRAELQQGRPGLAVRILRQVGEILDYVHARGVLHLDLKPANIIYSDSRSYLIDFGVFQTVGAPRGTTLQSTPAFAAPEVVEAQRLDARTDLYSLGATLHWLLRDDPLLEPRSAARCTMAPHLPGELSHLASRLLSEKPELRFQTVRSFLEALAQAFPKDYDLASSRRLPETDLVGRTDALKSFYDWFQLLGDPRFEGVLTVVGESGIGKTRFMEACMTEIRAPGVAVIPISPAERRKKDGVRVLVGKLKTLMDREGIDDATNENVGPASATERFAPSKDVDALEDDLRFVTEAVSHPTVIFVDDIDAVNDSLPEFVNRFAARVKNAQAPACLGILDSRELPPGDASKSLAIVTLSALDLDKSLRALAPLDELLTAEKRDEIARLSGGNPGRMRDLLSDFFRHGAVTASSDLVQTNQENTEFAGLDPDERALVFSLSLMEQPVSHSVLQDVTGLSSREFAQAKRHLKEKNILAVSGTACFLQNQPSEGCREDIRSDELTHAHETIGRRLLRTKRKREAVQHLLAAGCTDEALRTARELATKIRDAGEALSFYSSLTHFATDPDARAILLEETADLEEKSGRFDAAIESFDQMVRELDLQPSDRARVLRKRGAVFHRSGRSEEAYEAFDEALQILEEVENLDEQLHILGELASIHLFRGEFSNSTTFANRGLELLGSKMGEELKAESRARHTLHFRSISGHNLLRQFEYDRAIVEFKAGLEASQRIGKPGNTALILNNLGVAYWQSNRLDEALHIYGKAEKLAQRARDETTIYSIQCNVSVIRARRGENRKANKILDRIREMPHPSRSKRGRLFLLNSVGLAAQTELRDSREVWEECITLAEDLSDPNLSRSARLFLLENEISSGRWGHARAVLNELQTYRDDDERVKRSIDARHALLDSLCGRSQLVERMAATSFLVNRPPSKTRIRAPSADMWNWVLFARALLEVGDYSEARNWLERLRDGYLHMKQPPGALECTLLLADLSLRIADQEAARKWIEESKATVALHDSAEGSRGACIRIPYLEARRDILLNEKSPEEIAPNLALAAREFPGYCVGEMAWLLDLVGSEARIARHEKGIELSKMSFIRGLTADDSKDYLSRDHRDRLGLHRSPSTNPSAVLSDKLAEKRLNVLGHLASVRDPARALDLVVDACKSDEGAIFFDSGQEGLEIRREGRGASFDEEFRREALAVGTGPLDRGLCQEISDPDRHRVGVLYVSTEHREDAQLRTFLKLSALALGLLKAWRRSGVNSRWELGALQSDPEETKTAVAVSLVEGESTRMRKLFSIIRRTSGSRLPVLITGESGTGKDLIARTIHSLSPLHENSFVSLDCAAIPEALLEAELFGYEAGAFTGAQQSKDGYLLSADGGTVYLDNVDSLSLEVQAKFLRVLEEEEFRPLGAASPIRVNLRFIASSQRDLKRLCDRGEFRSDFYFRLAGICLEVPPLRERVADIPPLARHFLKQCPNNGLEITAEAMELLKNYSWPGNIRELDSLVQRLALTCEGRIDGDGVRAALPGTESARVFPRWVLEGRSYEQSVTRIKYEYLRALFNRFDGDIGRMAKEMNTTKRNVYLRFTQAGLDLGELRANHPEAGDDSTRES